MTPRPVPYGTIYRWGEVEDDYPEWRYRQLKITLQEAIEERDEETAVKAARILATWPKKGTQ